MCPYIRAFNKELELLDAVHLDLLYHILFFFKGT